MVLYRNLLIKDNYFVAGESIVIEFGEKLRKARETKGLTQQSLADMIFVTRQTVSRYENWWKS